jgi:hypothetical protein
LHALTLTELSKGKVIRDDKGKKLTILDKDSMLVLIRTVLENYLTFFAIYISPDSQDKKELRHSIYKYTEEKVVYDRLVVINSDPAFMAMNGAYGPLSSEHIKRQEDMVKEQRDVFEINMKQNVFYESLTKKQMDSIYKKPRPDWIKKSYFSYTYNMLSASVHTGSQSIGSHNLDGSMDMAYRALNLSTLMNLSMIVSKCVLEYCEFTGTKQALKANNEVFDLMRQRVFAGTITCVFEEDDRLRAYLNDY